MKVDLSKLDKGQIKASLEANALVRWLQFKDSVRFNVGDVLIKEHLKYRYNKQEPEVWDEVKVSERSTQPAKYVYVYEDPATGIGYIKKVKADGSGTIGNPMSLYDMDLNNVRFRVDPNFLDHTLLGEDADFDPAKLHNEEKARRAKIREENMKKVLKIKDDAEYEKWFQDNVGQSVWIGRDRTGDRFSEYTILKVKKEKRNLNWSDRSDVERGWLYLKAVDSNGRDFDGAITQFKNKQYGIVFTSRPLSIKDMV